MAHKGVPPEPETFADFDQGLDRRSILRTAGASTLLPLFLRPREAEAAQGTAKVTAPATKFFTPEEYAMVDELSEIIIPTDAHSPGARAAKVALEIDRVISDGPVEYEDNARRRRAWREGLQLVNTFSEKLHKKPFMSLTAQQRVDVVTKMAVDEKSPKTPETRFFRELKGATATAYYLSEIGLHKELEYMGNSYLAEYAGTDASEVPIAELLAHAAKTKKG